MIGWLIVMLIQLGILKINLLIVYYINTFNTVNTLLSAYVGKHLTPRGGVILKGLEGFRGGIQTVGSCENGIDDSIPILILGNH